MRRLLAVAIAFVLALLPCPARAASAYGSPGYGDPPGWCTNLSDMWIGKVVTNDPLVGTNPERDTFYGFHRNPGYDDWYGFFYGDFRGAPGDASGWVKLLHENYPQHYHWNFGDNGWAVHGHVKQYIAYYNWTFGGECSAGYRGSSSPPPYMADQYGYPVVDIYVDAVAPYPPQPYVADVTRDSVAFTWDPVADRGDGAGRDYFVAGIDHYVSWLTVSDRPGQLEYAVTSSPRTVTLLHTSPQETVCVHVQAVDRVQNATADQMACAAPLAPPPMPEWTGERSRTVANPAAPGLVGLDTWLWLAPHPSTITANEKYRGVPYTITATPAGVDWDFGDGTGERFTGPSGFGIAYPRASSVSHVFEAHSQAGYAIHAHVRYDVTWTATVGSRSFGPYPLGTSTLDALPLTYSVEQAQPELIAL
jgi:hypothetical protein